MARFLATIVMVLCAAMVAAQQPGFQEAATVEKSQVVPGVKRGELSFTSNRGVTDTVFVEVDFKSPLVSAKVAVPLAGPWSSEQLEVLASSVAAVSAMGLELKPPIEDDPAIEGLRFAAGRLYSWPSNGEPHVMLLPEGAGRIIEPRRFPGVVSFDDGTTLTLVSVNGAFPSSGRFASVYTGDLRSTELPVAGWSEDIVAVAIKPIALNADPHQLILEGARGDRRFESRRVTDRGGIRTSDGEALLVLRKPVDDGLLKFFNKRGVVTITAGMDAGERLAEAIFPPKAILVSDGVEVEGLPEDTLIRNALAMDAKSRRLMMIAPNSTRGRGYGTPVARLFEFLRTEGYRDAVLIDSRLNLLIPDVVKEERDFREAANAPVRMVLGIQERQQVLELPDVDGSLYRVRDIIATSNMNEFQWNTSSRLLDERMVPDTSLDQFFAAVVDRPAPRVANDAFGDVDYIQLTLPRPMPVAAVELIHAESVGFSPEFNLKSFRIIGRSSRQNNWRAITEVFHDESVARERVVLPGTPTLVEMRIQIIDPSFLPDGNVVRMAEIFTWSTEKSVR